MQVTVAIKTAPAKFPAGTVGGNWRIELMLASNPSTIAHEYEGVASSTVFDLTDGDVYMARGYRLDASGATIGPIAQDQFTVGQDLVVLEVADSITETSTPTRRAAKPA